MLKLDLEFQAHQNPLKSNFMIDSYIVYFGQYDILFIEIIN